MQMTLTHAREATSDLADNMEALKRNFLLRGYFNRRGYFDLDDISPADYRDGVLENGKRKASASGCRRPCFSRRPRMAPRRSPLTVGCDSIQPWRPI